MPAVATSIGKLPYSYEVINGTMTTEIDCEVQLFDADGVLRYLPDGNGGVTDRFVVRIQQADAGVFSLFDALVLEKATELQLIEAGGAIPFIQAMIAQGYRRTL